MNTQSALRLLAVAGLAATAVAGCQSSGTPSGGSAPHLASTTAAGHSKAGRTPSSSGSGVSTASGGFCTLLTHAPLRLDTAKPSPAAKAELLDRLHKVVAAAPAELKTDMPIIAQYYETILGHGHQVPSGGKFQHALIDFSHWAYQHCPGAMPKQ